MLFYTISILLTIVINIISRLFLKIEFVYVNYTIICVLIYTLYMYVNIIFIYIFCFKLFYVFLYQIFKLKNNLIFLIVVNLKLLLYINLIESVQLLNVLLLIEIFSMLVLFLIIIQRILKKIFIIWYFFMLNTLTFLILLNFVYFFYMHFIFTIDDIYTNIIDMEMKSYNIFFNLFLTFKLYNVVLALLFEEIYLQFSACFFFYMLTVYIFYITLIFLVLLYTIYIIFIQLIYFQILGTMLILFNSFNIISTLFLISNSNISLIFILLIVQKNYFLIIYILYHLIYSVNIAIFYLFFFLLSTFSTMNILQKDNQVFFFTNSFSFFSNYSVSYLLTLIIFNFSGLPINTLFFLKTITLTVLLTEVNTSIFNILILFNIYIYVYYIKILLNFFTVYAKKNLSIVYKSIHNLTLFKLIICVLFITNSDFLIFIECKW